MKVVPGVGALSLPEAQAEFSSRHKGEQTEVVKGLKRFGVRDFHYRMAFRMYCGMNTGCKNKLGPD